jgi:hypothetical protein
LSHRKCKCESRICEFPSNWLSAQAIDLLCEVPALSS